MRSREAIESLREVRALIKALGRAEQQLIED
jgi:hypothetical protein